MNLDGKLLEVEGVFNTGGTGGQGNIGTIELVDPEMISWANGECGAQLPCGVFFLEMALTKTSVEFQVDLPLGQGFRPEKLKEVSVPLAIPACLSHDVYGVIRSNVCVRYEYDLESFGVRDTGYVARDLSTTTYIFSVCDDGLVKVLFHGDGSTYQFF